MRLLGPGVYFPYDADFKDLRKQFDKDSGDVATIRSYGARFGKGVAVEPGITNIQTQSDFNTKLAGYNVTDGPRPADVVDQVGGWRRVPKISANGNTNAEILINISGYTVSQTQRYTQQFIFRFDGTRPTFIFTFFTNNGHHTVAATVTPIGNGIWHAMAYYEIETGGTTLRAIDITSITWGTSTYMDIMEPVIHLHAGVQATMTFPIRTSHVWGTRAVGSLKYNGWILPREQGTVSLWLRPNYDYTASEAGWRDLLRGQTTAASDEFRLTIGANAGNAGNLQIRFFASGASQKAIDFDPSAGGGWDPKQLYHIACSWSRLETVLYLNGARVGSSAGDFIRWSESAFFTVGCNPAPAEHIDGLIDDLAIFPDQLTDAQVALIYA